MQCRVHHSHFVEWCTRHCTKVVRSRLSVSLSVCHLHSFTVSKRAGAHLGGPCAYCPFHFGSEKIVVILVWKNYAKIWTLLKMYTWNVSPGTTLVRVLNTPLETSDERIRLVTTTRAVLCREGGIIFSSVRLWLCLSVRMLVLMSVNTIIFRASYYGQKGGQWWFSVSDVPLCNGVAAPCEWQWKNWRIR